MGIPLDKALVHGDLSCACDTPIPAKACLTSTGSKADAMGPKEFGKRKLIRSPGCPGPYSTLLTRIHFLERGRGRVVELTSLH